MAIDFSKTKEVNKSEEVSLVPIVVSLSPDIEDAQKSFDLFRTQIKEKQERAERLKVIDETTEIEATMHGTDVAALINAIEKRRKEIVAKPRSYIKAIDSLCNNLKDPLNEIKADMERKIKLYKAKEEAERREREKAAREEAKKLQEDLNREAEKKGIEPPKVPDITIPKQDNVTRLDSGRSSFQRKFWTYEMVDKSLLPREYLKVNEAAIRDAIKMGVRDIPGVRIFEDSKTIFKTG
jgi:hypothetical protein